MPYMWPACQVSSKRTNRRDNIVGMNQIDAFWTDNSGNETGFVIERCLEKTTGKGKKRVTTCNFGDYVTTGASITSFSVPTDSGYRYRVKAINAHGISAATNEASI